MLSPALIAQGNRPRVTDALVDAAGAAVNLTACTVEFAMQCGAVTYTKAATITTAATGLVEYTFAAGETDTPGDYQAQWRVTSGGAVTLYPLTGYRSFTIQPALPQVATTGVSLVSELYEPVRAILGDFNATIRKHEDSAIASVVRTHLNMGSIAGYALTANRLGIAPALTEAKALALLVLLTCKTFVAPAVGAYSYKTRAIGETFGDNKAFLFVLENEIYANANGAMFSSLTNFYSWANSVSGLDLWAHLSDVEINAPVETVTIS